MKLDWIKNAPCKGSPTEWWFSTNPGQRKKARALCGSCPYTKECLEYGLVSTKEINSRIGSDPNTKNRGNRILIGNWGGIGEFQIKKNIQQEKENEQ